MKDSVIEWNKICNTCNCRFVDRMSKPFCMRVCDFKDSIGICHECNEKTRVGFIKYREAASLNWTFDTVKEYFEKKPPYDGQELLIHDTSFNTNTYALVIVKLASSGKQKRIIIEGYTNGYTGQSFYRSGKNCFAPKGQARLLPYNTQIGSLIKNENGNQIRLSSKEVYELIRC